MTKATFPRVWVRFVYPKERKVGPWFREPGYVSVAHPGLWVQHAGSGDRPGPDRRLGVAGDPTPAEVEECKRWLAEADRPDFSSQEGDQPLSPDDLTPVDPVPDFAIDAINQLLRKHWNGRCAVLLERHIIEALSEVRPDFDAARAINFCPIYEAAGWRVEYVGPFDPGWRFTRGT